MSRPPTNRRLNGYWIRLPQRSLRIGRDLKADHIGLEAKPALENLP